jgi:cytochrome P450
MFSLEIHRHGPALRRMIAEFAMRLGRPYVLDLLLPARIPTLHDLARRRFRLRWIALMDEIIAARLSSPAVPTDGAPRDLFDMLLAARDPETGTAFSREQLRDQMATMIVAGHETTACRPHRIVPWAERHGSDRSGIAMTANPRQNGFCQLSRKLQIKHQVPRCSVRS